MIRTAQYCYPACPLPPATLAATVVLLRDGQDGQGGQTELEVLISQRAAKSSFVPSMYVFPGGRVDAADHDWAAQYLAQNPQFFPTAWPPRLHAQALAAVRECWEEMGVLLAVDAQGQPASAAGLAQLHRQQPLPAQMQALGLQPDIASLVWVCDRLPDASIAQRYHTAFFYAAMPAGQRVAPDLHEQLDAVWLPLAQWQKQREENLGQHTMVYPMIYPTLKTLEALAPFPSTAAALDAARIAGQQHVPLHHTRAVLQGGVPTRIDTAHLAYAEAQLVCPDGQILHSIDWQYDRPVPLLRHVLRLTCANPSMMSGPGTNTYLLGTPVQGFIVLDAGPAHHAHLRHILQATQGKILGLLCTHSHPDHSPAAVLLQRWLRRRGQHVPLMGMAAASTAAAHSRFRPTQAVVHGEQIHIPSADGQAPITLRILHTPGHAANHVCVLLEEDGLLFSGDHILSGTTTVIAPPDGNMQAYLHSLDVLDEACQRFDVQFILPAHGHVLGGSGTYEGEAATAQGAGARRIIAYYRQHRLAREAKVLAALRRTGLRENTAATRAQLLPLVYEDAPPALWPVAKRSLDAHLIRIFEQQMLCS